MKRTCSLRRARSSRKENSIDRVLGVGPRAGSATDEGGADCRPRRGELGAVRRAALVPVVAILFLGLFVVLRSGRSGPKEGAVAEAMDAGGAGGPELLDPGVDANDEGRSMLAKTGTVPDANAGVASGADRSVRDDELRGRVLDAKGRGIGGARVMLRAQALPAFGFPRTEQAESTRTLAETTTDPEGGFRCELEPDRVVDVVGSAQGFVEGAVAARRAGDFVELRLSKGSLVHGRITRARDGEPVEGARVRIFRFGGSPARNWEAKSSADGAYSIRIQGREPATLEVIPRAEQITDWIPVAFGADGTSEVNVVLEEGMRAEGRVTDALSGVPIEGARVTEGVDGLRWATTDASGGYSLAGTGNPNRMLFLAAAKGYGRVQRAFPGVAEKGVVRMDFALEPGLGAHGRLVDPRGRPIEGAYVAAIGVAIRGDWQETDWRSVETRSDGSFRIEDMTAGIQHVLLAGKVGWATHAFEFPASEGESPETDLGTLVLTPPAHIEGRVLDSEGARVVGVEVRLIGSNADRYSLGEGPERNLADRYVADRGARTDGEGGFRFEDVAEGAYTLRARQPGWASQPQRELEVEEGVDQTDLVLSMASGPSIAGRVVDEEGAPVLGVLVSLHARSAQGPRAVAGRSPGSLWTPLDGTFEFRGLLDGEYDIEASPRPFMESDSDDAWLRSILTEVRAGSTDLVVVVRRGATIHGVVLEADGTPAVGNMVRAGGDVSAPGGWILTDLEGRFALPVPKNTVCDLLVYSRLGGMGPLEILLTQPDVVSGSSGIVLQLPE